MTEGRIHDAAARGYQSSVERYERGRPSYPANAVEILVRDLDLRAGRRVLELGAGTGRFTALLVPTGATITAIEPVPAMREAFKANCPTVAVHDGTAEAIPVADGSVDAVVVAQAFHWFDGDRALLDIHRVLRGGGGLGLIWNVREETSDWSRRLTAIFDRLSSPDDPRYRSMRWRDAFDRTELFDPLRHQGTSHVHEVTRQGFLDRVLSVSYVASASPVDRERVVAEVTDLLDTDPELAGRERIGLPYRTDLYRCVRR